MNDSAEWRGISLATQLATRIQQRIVLAVLLVSAAIFCAAVPFAKVPLPRVFAFIPIYQSALVINDTITAVLLLGQAGPRQSRPLVVLAGGYLFTAVMAVFHMLTFPGLFAPAGLLGAGPQSTAWLYMFWHAGFPVFVIAYALLKGNERAGNRPLSAPKADMPVCAAIVLAAAAAGTILATAGQDWLPPIMRGDQYSPAMTAVVSSVWVLSPLGAAVLWWRRPHTVLDLWLIAVLTAWAFDIALAAVFNQGRYDLGFYAGRIYGLLAGSIVLLALLIENGILYRARVAGLESQRQALVAEIASREAAELRFRRVVEGVPSAIVIADKDGRITLVNPQSLANFGYERGELIGQPVEVLVPERFRAGHPGHRNGYLAAPVVRPMGTGRELLGRRKDGSEFPVDISLSPVDTAEGPQVIAAVTDITEHKLAQEKLRLANTALASVNKELEAFAYSTSHDLRQPLRGMTGFAEILLQDYSDKLDAEGKDYLLRIQAAAKRMGQLIDDLLGLARVSRGTLRREEVNLSGLARAAISELRQGQPRDGVTVEIQPDLVATGDPALLQAMLVNLLANAWKFTGNKLQSRIEFGSTTAEGERAFFVRDNGAGFDMAYANKLFGAFQRLHSAQEFPGTGIGLATAQRIVHRHGGRIWAQAAKTQGATFFFTLG